MYKAYNLTVSDWSSFPTAALPSRQTIEESEVRGALESYVKDGMLDGAAITKDWFPVVDADIFISHSRADCDDAQRLACFLQKHFNLTSFIDSSVWGYADDLLKQIDEAECWIQEKGFYDYNKRNGTTSHVHMMLAVALSEVIDACECAIFINSPNSITFKDSATKTKSPWLYYELAMLRMIRPKQSRRLLKEAAAGRRAMEHTVDLSKLTLITEQDLLAWADNATGDDDLGLLYRLAP